MWHEFFDFFEHALVSEGLLVVTTNGRSIAAKLREPATGRLWIDGAERQQAIVASYEASGFGFAEYPTSQEQRQAMDEPSRYGVSLSHPRWVCELAGSRPSLQLMTFIENRWGAQDVIGLMKVDRVEEGATSMKGVTGGIRRPRPELYQVDR